MSRYLITRALQILALAGAVSALIWVTGTDREVEKAAMADYCHAVAIWQAEAARGIDPHHRTGHPDYDERAAEDCPGMRPAGPAVDMSTKRQLAQE